MKKLAIGFIIGLFTTLLILIEIIMGKFSFEKIKKLYYILKEQE